MRIATVETEPAERVSDDIETAADDEIEQKV